MDLLLFGQVCTLHLSQQLKSPLPAPDSHASTIPFDSYMRPCDEDEAFPAAKVLARQESRTIVCGRLAQQLRHLKRCLCVDHQAQSAIVERRQCDPARQKLVTPS